MNKDQLKGSAKEAAGKVQSGAGRAMGSDKQRAKGALRQAEGKVQKGVGNVREDAKDAADNLRSSRRTRH